MKAEKKTSKTDPSARKLPAAGTAGTNLKWDGRTIPILMERGMWRLRSRSKSFPVDFNLGAVPIAEAKRLAKNYLEKLAPPEERSKGSLESVAKIYLTAPKRCRDDVAEANVSRLRAVVKTAWSKTLDDIPISEIPLLWPAYVAKRQGRERPDYNTRSRINTGINSAMKQAASVFIPSLRPYYRTQGLIIPPDATTIIWPAEANIAPAEADDVALLKAWSRLRTENIDLWLVVGLARFAGLRQSEILACRGKWIVSKGAASYVSLQDREADQFFTKTGKPYLALILNPDLAEYLKAIDKESRIITTPDAARWIARAPQAWLKTFTGKAKAPLHRLRGLYADHVKRETEHAILARQEAIREASKNLGHTSTSTTENHYLTPDDTMTS